METLTLKLDNLTLQNIFVHDFKSFSKYNEHSEDIIIFSCKKKYEEELLNILDKKEIKYDITGLETREFKGLVKEILVEDLDESTLIVRLNGIDESIKLKLNKNLVRLYQDTTLPVRKVIEDVLRDYKIEYHISKNIDMEIGRVYYQYNEDDWAFLVRILSDFDERIFINKEGIIIIGEEKLSEEEEVA
ncbi:hypothetical protein [Streptobacillus moniliformis]|uniref:hypothetical protein n=1 Tax=Streptobacillus moniliformis TaxID=34105 RepID=UPI0007E454BE|nr:hypothetical protein [Streptobacillus moniliformis]